MGLDIDRLIMCIDAGVMLPVFFFCFFNVRDLGREFSLSLTMIL